MGSYQLPVTNYQLPITNYQLPITNYQLPIINYQLPITNRKLFLLPLTLSRSLISLYLTDILGINGVH